MFQKKRQGSSPKKPPSVRINIRGVLLCERGYRHPAMQRRAKRARKAAKPHGETSPAQKAFATVGSAVRDGAFTGLLSANLNVAPILFFTALVHPQTLLSISGRTVTRFCFLW